MSYEEDKRNAFVQFCRRTPYSCFLEAADQHDYDHDTFLAALAHCFEMDPELAYDIANYDNIWFPTSEDLKRKSRMLNVIQCLTVTPSGRDVKPAEAMIIHLFDKTDFYGESFTDIYQGDEQTRIDQHLEKMKDKYGSKQKYLEQVNIHLWRGNCYILI